MTYYAHPYTHYTSIFWILVRVYGLTIEEANTCINENRQKNMWRQ